MLDLADLPTALRTLFTTVADELARSTGFVQRESKVTGAVFAQALVFGWLEDPQATLESLAQTFAALGVALSPQGLDQRLMDPAAKFLRCLLERAAQTVVRDDQAVLPLLRRFVGVYVLDSTLIPLPPELAAVWPGCTPGQAMLKLQVQLDLVSGELHLELQVGRASDHQATALTTPLPAGALRLEDLGYFDVAQFAAWDTADELWLSRYQTGTALFFSSGAACDLPTWLATQPVAVSVIDQPMVCGATTRLPCRLVAQRVPPEVAAERRRKLQAQARAKGQTVSAARLALADWVIAVTNVPPTQLTATEVGVVLRCRWQIELLFDRWKTLGGIGQSRSTKVARSLAELFAKLLGHLVQHWLFVATCWQFPDRSLRKATTTLRRFVFQFLLALSTPARFQKVLATLCACLAAGCRINKRYACPHTYQLLLACDSMEN